MGVLYTIPMKRGLTPWLQRGKVSYLTCSHTVLCTFLSGYDPEWPRVLAVHTSNNQISLSFSGFLRSNGNEKKSKKNGNATRGFRLIIVHVGE